MEQPNQVICNKQKMLSKMSRPNYKQTFQAQIQNQINPNTHKQKQKMLNPQYYKPQQLYRIEQKNKYSNRPELYLKPQILVQQKEFIKQVIYMIQGLQTQLFVKVYDEIEFDQQKGECQRVFRYSLRQDCRTIFTHLTHETIKTCAQGPVKVANLVHYLTSKSTLIYANTSNVLLKSFSQGIIQFLSRLTTQFTSILTQLQKEGGNISNFNEINNSTSFQGHNDHISLLKITYLFDQKVIFISELVGIVSKVLPYMSSSQQSSPTDNYQVIQILFNEFSRLMDLIELSEKDKHQILLIYQNSLMFYITLIQNWIQMNPYLLESQKNQPFFINLSQVNFTLSKSAINSQVYQKLRNPSYMTLELREQAYKSEEFVELFFKLENLLIEEYLPEMFKRQGLCILELGKIVQFIYLYFSVQEKPLLAKYLNVQQQFQKLFDLIKVSSPKGRDLNNTNCTQIKSFFSIHSSISKTRKHISISQKLGQKIRKPYRTVRVFGDNPYQMFQNTRGAFVDCETTISSINSQTYNQTNQKYNNKPIQSLAFIKMDQEKPTQVQSKQNFSIKFERMLSQIIERLYEKALFFFQQQSQRQFFKLQSHINIPSQSLILHQNPSILQKRNNFISMHQNLSLLTNHERIIQSISLTLIGIKKFMLYQQGDFFLELISLVHTIFENSSAKISRSLITSHIEEAIRSSSANNLPQDIKRKISFLFLKKTKDPQIKHLKVWSVFSTLYRPEFPINCIFNNEIMHSFGQIFNFIFNIKQCQHSLKSIWDDFKQNAKIETQYSLFQTKKHPFQSKILAVRNNMHHFINLIFGFVMISIESLWTEYIQEINFSFLSNLSGENTNEPKVNRKLHNPISLIKLTHQLLKNLKLQTTQNVTLTNTMILICELLGKFKKLLKIQPDSKEWSDVIFKQEIQYIGHQFMGIMELAKAIEGIGEAIFYNNQM